MSFVPEKPATTRSTSPTADQYEEQNNDDTEKTTDHCPRDPVEVQQKVQRLLAHIQEHALQRALESALARHKQQELGQQGWEGARARRRRKGILFFDIFLWLWTVVVGILFLCIWFPVEDTWPGFNVSLMETSRDESAELMTQQIQLALIAFRLSKDLLNWLNIITPACMYRRYGTLHSVWRSRHSLSKSVLGLVHCLCYVGAFQRTRKTSLAEAVVMLHVSGWVVVDVMWTGVLLERQRGPQIRVVEVLVAEKA